MSDGGSGSCQCGASVVPVWCQCGAWNMCDACGKAPSLKAQCAVDSRSEWKIGHSLSLLHFSFSPFSVSLLFSSVKWTIQGKVSSCI